MNNLFDLTGKVAVVTGGAGLLGLRHCEALLEAGAQVVCLDLRMPEGEFWDKLRLKYSRGMSAVHCDVTDKEQVLDAVALITENVGSVNILVNNACNNPPVDANADEAMGLARWENDLDVGLTGPYLCSREFGKGMAQRGKGIILNIASEYGVLAPDQRLYRKPGLLEHQQPIKPSSYSVVKHGIIEADDQTIVRRILVLWSPDVEGVRVEVHSYPRSAE